MAEVIELKAQAREGTGKLANRALRAKKLVPGIVYGGEKGPANVALEYRHVWQHYQTGHFLSTVYLLDIDGKKERVIPRDVQVDPVRDFPIHVDFLRVSKSSRIEVEIPVHFVNEEASPGLKRGGALNIVRHAVELSCPADSIPEFITVDLTGYDIGDSIHISAVKLPAGITPTITDRDFTVATIAGAAAQISEEAAEAAAAEKSE
ncbi:ribosomal 5S rRNA E-loop binding protein Ctc/L25/TL5 [Rhodomicrobium vannielii ATCC 17100]|jgi:large subunit ribosomal protein L25|uniref:Large ribosomal subunit protein bL25 n=1 Tax=Rhodomicrobium vannielii (strain ATCC 17100 / DSM 162 / LMG 4299 / NCIMB 10020 / ATH 3.1.1) TaxID=648757 RepID=E3HYY8_RHOVT|nr:50S ribosomal protein L25/general stress protein Ctc [Rhodomicrobium vannielii]ADP70963.1 ribosomal 5S rRNA E-loop binding protein Ctc/L25/TL5 [Rhodomicrobium vannielii ATCC 17100]